MWFDLQGRNPPTFWFLASVDHGAHSKVLPPFFFLNYNSIGSRCDRQSQFVTINIPGRLW